MRNGRLIGRIAGIALVLMMIVGMLGGLPGAVSIAATGSSNNTSEVSHRPLCSLVSAFDPGSATLMFSESSTPQVIQSTYASTPPVIDGLLSLTEWESPLITKTLDYFNSITGQDETHEMLVYFMNDNASLYVAIRITNEDFESEDIQLDDVDVIELYFDNDNDEVVEANEDIKNFWNLKYSDWFYNPSEEHSGRWSLDERQDGTGAASHSTHSMGDYIYEFEIPLNSGDIHDLAITTNSIVGIKILYREMYYNATDKSWHWKGEDGWLIVEGRFDGTTYGKLVLSSGSPDGQLPEITGVEPVQPEVRDKRQPFSILGGNFVSGLKVTLKAPDGREWVIPRSGNPYINVTSTRIDMQAGFLISGTWTVWVTNPDEQKSNEYNFDVKLAPIAAIDAELLRLIDEYVNKKEYWRDTWKFSKNQYKAWIATLAWSEGGEGGYVAHSQHGLGSDVFNHVKAGTAFRFSTGIGPFQIDCIHKPGWTPPINAPTMPTIDKLDYTKALKIVLQYHYNTFAGSYNLGDLNSSTHEWIGARDMTKWPGLWKAVTGTDWSTHRNNKDAPLDWESIKVQLASNADSAAYRYGDNVKEVGYLPWNISKVEGIETDDDVFVGRHRTWLITARDDGGDVECTYYYAQGEGLEFWVWNNYQDPTNRFRYIFVREYAENQYPINRNTPSWGIAGHVLDKPALDIPSPIASAEIKSPAEIRVCDSQGRVTGLTNGELKEEIPNSFMMGNTIFVFAASDSYRYEVVGTAEGTYGMDVVLAGDEETHSFSRADAGTSPGELHRYAIDWDALSEGKEGVTIEIDSDGDGDFEKTIVTSQPNTPTSPSPVNHATDLSTSADLSWTGGDPDVGDTVTYGVHFGTSSSPPLKDTIGPYPATQSSTTYDPGTLVDGATYYWQIIARDNHGITREGPVWDFTAGLPKDEPGPEVGFASLIAEGKLVIAYNFDPFTTVPTAVAGWTWYDPTLPPSQNNLAKLHKNTAYWIKVTEECWLTYGTQSYHFGPDWNNPVWLGC